MPKRVLLVVILAALLAGGAFWLLRDQEALPASAMTQEEMARAVGGPVMLNLVRGHVPGRSGEIMLVPKPHHFMINEWDLRTLGGELVPELVHATAIGHVYQDTEPVPRNPLAVADEP